MRGNSTFGEVHAGLIEKLDVSVEAFLGGASITIADLNALKAGSVLKLDASLSDHVEVRVNGVLIALGELVAVGDKFGVRIATLSP